MKKITEAKQHEHLVKLWKTYGALLNSQFEHRNVWGSEVRLRWASVVMIAQVTDRWPTSRDFAIFLSARPDQPLPWLLAKFVDADLAAARRMWELEVRLN